MPLNDRQDLLDARRAADQAAANAMTTDSTNQATLILQSNESVRLEIRALGVAISHALDEAIRARP